MEQSLNELQLYYHAPCFDGAVSAALTSEYVERVLGCQAPKLKGVNYQIKTEWLSFQPPKPFAVVDFLYHPAVDLWADHHATAFLNETARADFEARKNPRLMYDKTASSCAVLLWKNWGNSLKDRAGHFAGLVHWADRIDSARYDSVAEAITLPSPALQINLALGLAREADFSNKLVALFRSHTIEEIAALPAIHEAFTQGQRQQEDGLQRLKDSIRITADEIAVFDLDATGVLVNRYAPFYFFPEARYSAGLIRGNGDPKLTTMRNPWREFPSAPLGQLCASFGGGGHQRVGSIVLKGRNGAEAGSVLAALVEQISTWEKQQPTKEPS